MYGFIIGAIVVIGIVVYCLKRKAYIARKEASLKQSAADLAKEEAGKVAGAANQAARAVDKAVTDAAGKVS